MLFRSRRDRALPESPSVAGRGGRGPGDPDSGGRPIADAGPQPDAGAAAAVTRSYATNGDISIGNVWPFMPGTLIPGGVKVRGLLKGDSGVSLGVETVVMVALHGVHHVSVV